MINKARHTKKFCILGTAVADLAQLHDWSKLCGYSIIAVATYTDRTYSVRVVTAQRALLDLIVDVTLSTTKVLSSITVVDAARAA